MAVMKIAHALIRIKAATEDSRIALYHSGRPGYVEAAFADTSRGLYRMEHDPSYIGAYYADALPPPDVYLL